MTHSFFFFTFEELTNQKKKTYKAKQIQHQHLFLPMSIISENRISLIEERIFLGDSIAAKSAEFLASKGITHILNVADNVPNYHPTLFVYKRLEVKDMGMDVGMERVFDEGIQFISQAISENGKVLIHCVAGINRSPTMTVAYLMKEKNMELKIAFEHVRERRRIVDPLPDNITQLISFEKKLRGDDCEIPEYFTKSSFAEWWEF